MKKKITLYNHDIEKKKKEKEMMHLLRYEQINLVPAEMVPENISQ